MKEVDKAENMYDRNILDQIKYCLFELFRLAWLIVNAG
jgi:hypothetical protein